MTFGKIQREVIDNMESPELEVEYISQDDPESTPEKEEIDFSEPTGPTLIHGTSAYLRFTGLNPNFPLENIKEIDYSEPVGAAHIHGTSAYLRFTDLNENSPLKNIREREDNSHNQISKTEEVVVISRNLIATLY